MYIVICYIPQSLHHACTQYHECLVYCAQLVGSVAVWADIQFAFLPDNASVILISFLNSVCSLDWRISDNTLCIDTEIHINCLACYMYTLVVVFVEQILFINEVKSLSLFQNYTV